MASDHLPAESGADNASPPNTINRMPAIRLLSCRENRHIVGIVWLGPTPPHSKFTGPFCLERKLAACGEIRGQSAKLVQGSARARSPTDLGLRRENDRAYALFRMSIKGSSDQGRDFRR